MLVTNFLYRACQISTVLKATSDDESAIPGYLYVEVCSILFMIFLRFNYHFREFWSASLLFDSVICINNLFFWESYHVVIGFFFIADILNLSFIYVYLTYTWMNYVFFFYCPMKSLRCGQYQVWKLCCWFSTCTCIYSLSFIST